MGSELAALSGSGLKLVDLEKETEPQPSCRRRYHCWLSRPLPMPRPKGFELKRLLVHKDLGEEVTQGDSIVLDIMKFLTTVTVMCKSLRLSFLYTGLLYVRVSENTLSRLLSR